MPYSGGLAPVSVSFSYIANCPKTQWFTIISVDHYSRVNGSTGRFGSQLVLRICGQLQVGWAALLVLAGHVQLTFWEVGWQLTVGLGRPLLGLGLSFVWFLTTSPRPPPSRFLMVALQSSKKMSRNGKDS